MRILFFSSHPNLGLFDEAGYATHMRSVIDALRQKGHVVDTLIAGGENKTNDEQARLSQHSGKFFFKKIIPTIIWETLKDIRLFRFDKRLQRTLEERIKNFRPDFVYERVNYSQVSGVRACRKLGIKHIAEVNSPYTEERVFLQGKTLFKRKSRILEKELFELSDRIIVVSSALRDYFGKRYPTSIKKIKVVPNAVNTKDAVVIPKLVDEIKKKYRLIGGKTVIGFVGSIAPWHGIERLLQCAAELAARRDDVVFLVVGGGQLLQTFKAKAGEMELNKHVMWTGSVPPSEVYSYVSVMDITVMPDSNWYGSPIKIFEYGLLEKPVIAPDCGPLRDVMTNNVDGILIPAGTGILSKAIEFLLSDVQQREEMGKNFYRKIISNYTWDKVADTIIMEGKKEQGS